jgi:putative peptidoglycan lipid II flippase
MESQDSLRAQVTVEQAPAEDIVTAAEPQRRGLAKSATLITLGNLAGSVLGMIRLLFLNILFYGRASGAFTVSLRPVQQVNDLIIGGSVSGALIPTFVDYGQEERRAELRKVYNTVATLVTILMVLACVGVITAAPYFVPLETQRFSPADQELTVRLVQIASVSLLGLGLYAVGSALLYALKQVVFPAFAASLYHLAIIICGSVVLLWALYQAGLPFDAALQPGADNPLVEATRAQGAHGLAFGAAVGAAAEFLLLLIPLRRILKVWRPALHLRHPGVRQILRLYAPLTGGLFMAFVISNLELTLIGLTSGGAPQNATSLASATTLIQFPIGLVSSALSFSILPLLVPAVNSGDIAGFKGTLRLGIRLALLLMVPAAVGLIVLREPIVVLLFQHGACAHACTYRNTLALQNLAYQLPFVALYTLLVAAFFARKNTVTPVLVGVLGILSYAAIGTPLTLALGLPGVAFANGIGPTVQAVALFALLSLQIGDLGLGELASGAMRIMAAAAVMAGACWGMLQLLPLLDASIFSLDTFLGVLLTVCVVGGVGIGVYFAFAVLFRVEEVRFLVGFARARLRR